MGRTPHGLISRHHLGDNSTTDKKEKKRAAGGAAALLILSRYILYIYAHSECSLFLLFHSTSYSLSSTSISLADFQKRGALPLFFSSRPIAKREREKGPADLPLSALYIQLLPIFFSL